MINLDKIRDKDNYVIELYENRWSHIKQFHPEMEDAFEFLSECLKDPDFIQSGNKDEILSVKKFKKSPVTYDKYCIVVYKRYTEKKTGFIITAYFSRNISKQRKIIWTKS